MFVASLRRMRVHATDHSAALRPYASRFTSASAVRSHGHPRKSAVHRKACVEPARRQNPRRSARVKIREGAAEVTAESLQAFATWKLAHYKIPRYVLVVGEFPMTVTGKVRKIEM